jgi:hypothetical protein
MQTATSPAPYAVLRVDKRKAKAMGAIAAASAHQMRERPTPNADADGPAPIVMHLAAGTTPYQAASALLDGAERRNRTTVLAREIVLSASPSFFRPGREQFGGEFNPLRVKAWATAALEWAKRIWPDQLASFVLHLDEVGSPHAHLICVPRERKPVGGWKLNCKKFFDKERLRELQTSYGEALAPLGIRRGEPGSKATHSEVRQFYGAIHRAKNGIARPVAPLPPKRQQTEQRSPLRESLEPLLSSLGVETEQSKKRKAYEQARRAWGQQMKEYRAKEENHWNALQALAAIAPLRRKERESAGIQSVKPKPSPKMNQTYRLGPR